MHRRIFEIFETKRNFGCSDKIYSFGINKNGGINTLENDLICVIEDMHKKGLININEFHNLLDFKTKMSLSNVSKNFEIPLKNLNENLKLISKEINHESV